MIQTPPEKPGTSVVIGHGVGTNQSKPPAATGYLRHSAFLDLARLLAEQAVEEYFCQKAAKD